MPGPVGGDFYSETALVNYTYMYIKSVENVLLQKSVNNFFNKSTTEFNKNTTESKPEEKAEEKNEEKNLKELQVIKDFESEEDTSEGPKETESKPETKEDKPTNVFSANYDNFFNKNINASLAADIVKNISSTKGNILEKASETFPGIKTKLYSF